MREITQSPLRSLYNCHPQAYFLIETVMHRASIAGWESITEKIDVVDEDRLNQIVKAQVRSADLTRANGNLQEFLARYRPNHRFQFFGYKEVQAEIAPTTFLCRRCGYIKSLEKAIASEKLDKNQLTCPSCKIVLKQVVHIFGHSRCGYVEEIEPRRCRECGETYKLIIDNSDFGNSEWRCPNGHTAPLVKHCPSCTDEDGKRSKETQMKPFAAAQAIKPASITMVDISADADWEDVARRRLDIKEESLRDAILEHYKSDPLALAAVKSRLDSGEMGRRQTYEQFLEMRPDLRGVSNAVIAALGGEPELSVQRLLAEYRGTEQASSSSLANVLDDALAGLIARKFSITPLYISSLPVLQMVYGYQVGSSNVEKAKLRTFDRGWDSIVLTHRMKTEAALFQVSPSAALSWVNSKLGSNFNEVTLHKMLLRPGTDKEAQRVNELLESLLHTMSHLLIRQSELFTGLSRESLSEMIFGPALAFAIYCEDGSELGALRSAFASERLYEWFRQAYRASRECAHDPVCAEAKVTQSAACHACLFISERKCNGFWNGKLDRRLISDVRNNDGFWDR